MTDLTPPQAPEPDPAHSPASNGTTQASPPTAPPAASTSRGALTAITIAAAILGGGALVIAGGGAALAAVSQVASSDGSVGTSTSIDTSGVTALKVDIGRGSAAIRFADVDEATMRATGEGNGDWTMRREGDTLRVERPGARFGWWIAGWFGDEPQMTLTLPRELEGELSADLQLDAGALTAAGRFDTLSTTVNAGSLTIEGGADSVRTRVTAGSATLRLEDATTVDLSMSAGDMNATIMGSQPDETHLDVSAGSMDVTLPSGRYALSKDVSAGSLDTRIQNDASSSHRIQASLSAGSMVVREGS